MPAAVVIVIVVAMTGTFLAAITSGLLLTGFTPSRSRVNEAQPDTAANYVTSTSSPFVGLTRAQVIEKHG